MKAFIPLLAVCACTGCTLAVRSPDGRTVAKTSPGWSKVAVVIGDRKEKLGFNEVRHLQVSNGGKHYAYVGVVRPLLGSEEKYCVVVDGKKVGDYQDVELAAPSYTRDASHLVYAVRGGDKWYVVVDGRISQAYDKVYIDNPFFFTEDGCHFVYFADRGDQVVGVLDGIEIPSPQDPQDVALLRALLGFQPSDRAELMKWLRFPVLTAFLQEHFPKNKGELRALALSAQSPVNGEILDQVLSSSLGSQDQVVRENAACVLAMRGDSRAPSQLMEMLLNRSPLWVSTSSMVTGAEIASTTTLSVYEETLASVFTLFKDLFKPALDAAPAAPFIPRFIELLTLHIDAAPGVPFDEESLSSREYVIQGPLSPSVASSISLRRANPGDPGVKEMVESKRRLSAEVRKAYARKTLVLLTKVDFGTDYVRWTGWWQEVTRTSKQNADSDDDKSKIAAGPRGNRRTESEPARRVTEAELSDLEVAMKERMEPFTMDDFFSERRSGRVVFHSSFGSVRNGGERTWVAKRGSKEGNAVTTIAYIVAYKGRMQEVSFYQMQGDVSYEKLHPNGTVSALNADYYIPPGKATLLLTIPDSQSRLRFRFINLVDDPIRTVFQEEQDLTWTVRKIRESTSAQKE
jgi:hypothetical protein